jgi:hypothetical protein
VEEGERQEGVLCVLVRSLPEGKYDYVDEEFEECVEEEVVGCGGVVVGGGGAGAPAAAEEAEEEEEDEGVDDGMQLLTANQLSRKAAMEARVWDEEPPGAGTMAVDVDPPKDPEEEQELPASQDDDVA